MIEYIWQLFKNSEVYEIDKILPKNIFEKLFKYSIDDDFESFRDVLEAIISVNEEIKIKLEELEKEKSKPIHIDIDRDKLKKDIKALSSEALLLLKKFSIFPSVEIEYNDLIEYLVIKDEEVFKNSLTTLVKKELIIQNENSYELREELKNFIVEDFKPSYEEVEETIIYFANKLYLENNENPIDYIKYLDFAKFILEIIRDENENIASLANNLAISYKGLNNLNEALKYQKIAMKIMENIKLDSIILANIYNNISTIYRNLSNLKEALNFAKKSLEIREKELDKNDLNLATSYNNISTIYQDLGNLKEALNFAKKVNEIFEKELNKDDVTFAISYHNISMIYRDLENFEEALKYSKKDIDILLKNKFDEKKHYYLASSYKNLSHIYKNLKEYGSALEFAKKSYEIYKYNSNYMNLESDLKWIKELIEAIKEESKPKLKIVKIKNFKLLEEFEIEFSEKINVLIGQNSSGKTSLLQAISLALYPQVVAKAEEFNHYITKTKNDFEVKLEFNNLNVKLNLNDEEAKREINQHFKPFILTYSSNIFTKYREYGYDLVLEELINKSGKYYFVTSIFDDYYDKLFDPLVILEKLDKVEDKRGEFLKSEFKRVLEIFLNSSSKERSFEIVKINTEYYIKGFSQKPLGLKDLSEGYRNNILILTDILIRIFSYGFTPTSASGIVLIDEFDRHLHPKWQSGLLKEMENVFPNLQFILTTHHPMAIIDRKAKEINELIIKDDKIEAYKRGFGTNQIDIGTIFLTYFGVDSLIGESMKRDLDKFAKLKIKDELNLEEEKELNRLEEKYENSVASNFIFNNKYFTFLKFLKKNKGIDFDKYESLSEEELLKELEAFREEMKI